MASAITLPLRDPRWLLLLVGYFFAGRIALGLPHATAHVTLLWLPIGLAVAAFSRWGSRGSIAVLLGSMAVNLSLGGELFYAVAFAIGGTLGPLVTAELLRRLGFDPGFRAARDAGIFVAAAVAGSCVSATIGSGTLGLTGARSDVLELWCFWLAGDLLGVLIVAPPLLAVSTAALRDIGRRRGEVLLWLGLIVALSIMLFFAPGGARVQAFALGFVPLALVVWASLRFGVCGAGLGVLCLALIATGGAAAGRGPVASLRASESRILLWSYLGTAALLSLMVGAIQAGRRRAEKELQDSRAMLDTLRHAQAGFIGTGDPRRAFEDLLQAVLRLTESEYGFIAEVHRDASGRPFLRTLAFTNITWDDASRALYARSAATGLEFHNLETLFGRVLTSEAAVIANDAPRDPRAGGLPPGHPPLRRFLGLPFFLGSALTGVVGVANRADEYGAEDAQRLDPFLATCATLVGAVRDLRRNTSLQALGNSRNRVLDRLAEEAPLLELLDLIVREIEGLIPRWRGSILLLDPLTRRLVQGAAPNLPWEWNTTIHGLAIGPAAGSCGSAAYHGQPMVAVDVQTHPNWEGYRELAEKCGIRSCTSLPILDREASVLGTFALYSGEVGEPGAENLAIVSEFARIASVAIQKHRVSVERARAEAELKRSEELLRRTGEVAKIGGWELDLSSNRLIFSPEVSRLHGVGAAARPKPDEFTQNYPPEARQKLFAAVRLARKEARSWDLELPFIDATGRHIWVRIQGVPEVQQGRVVRLRGTLQDITERKAAEVERAQLESQLQQAQRMDALGTLAGGIAHDFNNILSAIVGYAELAAIRLPREHRAVECVTEISKAGLRARELIQQILAFARPQQRPASRLALGPVVQESLGMLRATLPAGIHVAAECAAEVPSVQADATQIQQVLMNLGTNAWHALDGRPGHIRIRLETIPEGRAASEVPPFISETPHPRITVEDDGTGMDAATQARIFEPFFTTKEVGRGTGLGLSVAHGIVHNLGGVIRVRSAIGQGSVFEVDLPAAPETGGTAPTASALPLASARVGTPRAGLRVLVLDDEPALVELARRALEPMGCVVSGFTDPLAAIQAIESTPGNFDILVVDFNMPELSGLDVARRVRSVRPELPLVLASGYLTIELREQAMSAGVAAMLAKPYHLADLASAVAHHSAKSSASVG